MFSVAPNIVLAPNMTQNANTGRRTQTLLISSSSPLAEDVECNGIIGVSMAVKLN